MAREAVNKMGNIWRSRMVSLNLKLRVLWATVFPIAIWKRVMTMQKADERSHVDAFEMWCYRWVLRIQWTERKTNAWVTDKIGNMLNMLREIVRRRKLRFFGHCNSKEGTRKNDHHREGQRKAEREAVPQHGLRTSRALQGWQCKRLWEQQRIGRDDEKIVKTTASHNATSDWREREKAAMSLNLFLLWVSLRKTDLHADCTRWCI